MMMIMTMMRMTIMMMMMMSIMMMMMMMMMTMTDYLVTLAWTECWTGRLQCSERSGRKKPQWCSNLGQWWQYRRREVDHILMGGGLSFLTFAICWFDRQGTSSQYQYCYWSTIVIWILSSDIVSSTNSIQIVRRQCCLWFDSADNDNNEYEYSSSITLTRPQ